jgi:hypothetical protein
MPAQIKYVILISETCNYTIARVSLESKLDYNKDPIWVYDYTDNISRRAGSMRYTQFKPSEVFDTRAEAEKHAQLWIVHKVVDKKLESLKMQIEQLQKDFESYSNFIPKKAYKNVSKQP